MNRFIRFHQFFAGSGVFLSGMRVTPELLPRAVTQTKQDDRRLVKDVPFLRQAVIIAFVFRVGR